MPLPDSNARFVEGIVPSGISRQHTAFLAGSSTHSTQKTSRVLALVVPAIWSGDAIKGEIDASAVGLEGAS